VSKKALGRGLDALIPQGVMDTLDTEKVAQIPVDRIRANPHQPRKRFDEEKIQSLADSIRADGVLQPVVVRKKESGYELIMGERRLQAARLAGMPTVPAVVRTAADMDTLRLALVENLHRALADKFGLSQQELASMVGKDRSSVANTLRLLGLPEEIRSMIIEGELSEGHARALLSLSTRAEQLAWAKRIVAQQIPVRAIEAEIGGRSQDRFKHRMKPRTSKHWKARLPNTSRRASPSKSAVRERARSSLISIVTRTSNGWRGL
jgi:ParB family chromosome partitioning protein